MKSISKLIDSILCPKQAGSNYHGLKCHMGECTSCGVKRFCCCPGELLQDARTIKVKVFKDVETGTSEGGKMKKRKELLCQEMRSADLLQVFKTHLQKLIKHDFVYRFGRLNSSNCAPPHIFQMMLLYLWWTSPKITHSRSRMKSNPCIGIQIKSPFLYT